MSAVLQTSCKNCSYEFNQMRRKTASNGALMIAYQCLQCGHATSPWLKRSAVDDINSLARWDEALSDAYYEKRRDKNISALSGAAYAETLANGEWWNSYNAYLRTPAWRSKRAQVMQRSGGWCEGCRQQAATQVHHLTYKHVKNEFLWELVAICDECHDRAHSSAAE